MMILTGECCHCGACCREVALDGIPPVDGYCHRFNRATERCGDYENRPAMCRKWPANVEVLRPAVTCTLTFVELELCRL